MLQPPDIDHREIAATLRAAYGVTVSDTVFLPVGADPDAAAWRVTVSGGSPLFLKTRFGTFDPAGLAVPRFLRDAGIAEVLAPLPTRDGALSVAVGATTLVLYPFVDGRNGFEVVLTAEGWTALGTAMRRIHETALPACLARLLDIERFTQRWRDCVLRFMNDRRSVRDDAVTAALGARLDEKGDDIALIAHRAGKLADALSGMPGGFVLCHTDIHAGNVLVGSDGGLHIVDWDSPRLAPKERDLMFIGGGVGGTWNKPEEAALFHEGYGAAEIAPVALAYYRYERIVEDITVTREQVFLGNRADREESLAQLSAQWPPGDVVDIAHATYAKLQLRLV